jgi:hypothetical protein
MKKWIILFLIAVLCLGSCKKEEPKEEIADKKDPHAYLASLKDKPSKEDDVFIVANDGTYNEELLDAFLEKCEKKEDCDLVIARYTIEGDVIYELLVYTGTYSLYTDNSRDAYKGSDIEDERRKYLYEYSYQKEEEYGDGKGTEESRFLFLSDKELQSDKEVQSEFEKMWSGLESDLVIVFSDFKRVG